MINFIFLQGTCGVRWAFVLAVISFFDCWVLGCLAFTLAHRVVAPAPATQESHYMNPASIYKGTNKKVVVARENALDLALCKLKSSSNIFFHPCHRRDQQRLRRRRPLHGGLTQVSDWRGRRRRRDAPGGHGAAPVGAAPRTPPAASAAALRTPAAHAPGRVGRLRRKAKHTQLPTMNGGANRDDSLGMKSHHSTSRSSIHSYTTRMFLEAQVCCQMYASAALALKCYIV